MQCVALSSARSTTGGKFSIAERECAVGSDSSVSVMQTSISIFAVAECKLQGSSRAEMAVGKAGLSFANREDDGACSTAMTLTGHSPGAGPSKSGGRGRGILCYKCHEAKT